MPTLLYDERAPIMTQQQYRNSVFVTRPPLSRPRVYRTARVAIAIVGVVAGVSGLFIFGAELAREVLR